MRPDNGIQLFSACRCEVAEGPRWNAEEQTLYWVDIPQGTVYRQKDDSRPEDFEMFNPGVGKIGALAFFQGKLLLFAEQCRVWICAFGGKPELFAELPGKEYTRFNDVLADRCGHFFCGVAWTSDHPGELWLFQPETREFACLENDLHGMPNGMGISPDRKTFYFAVSEEHLVYRYDFNEPAGTLSGRRIFAKFPADAGNPDGLTVDPETGNVVIAFWDGFHLAVCDSDGTLKKEICFAAAKVTSAEFAGNTLYVTTGNRPWNESEWENDHIGGVFRLIEYRKAF